MLYLFLFDCDLCAMLCALLLNLSISIEIDNLLILLLISFVAKLISFDNCLKLLVLLELIMNVNEDLRVWLPAWWLN